MHDCKYTFMKAFPGYEIIELPIEETDHGDFVEFCYPINSGGLVSKLLNKKYIFESADDVIEYLKTENLI